MTIIYITKGDLSMSKLKHIYIVHADAYIGSYKPGRCPAVSYAPQEKFIDFVKGLREDYPDYKLSCVDNEGIREIVRDVIWQDKQLENQILISKMKNRSK